MARRKPTNFLAEDAKLGKNVKVWHFACGRDVNIHLRDSITYQAVLQGRVVS
jgi:acyl-[acyl carrier protein]--UDP-N-acetylglucosamine O-acyltransferase